MANSFLIYCFILFITTLGIGLLTLVKKWEDEPLHLFVSFGAGIFLGVVFLQIVPAALIDDAPPLVPALLLAGFLTIFFLERFLLTHGDGGVVHEHKAVAITVLLGLTVHSLIEGLGLAALNSNQQFGPALFFSILAHNIPAAISLVSLFLLARFSKKLVVLLLFVFSFSTPGAAVISLPLFSHAHGTYTANLSALTAGSLLYVATGELLPEVFHTSTRKWLKLALLITGIAVILFIELFYH